MPRLSVVIPNYNHGRYLAQRMDSVLGQTYRDFDVLFLDDASTDNSRDVFKPYRKDPRIREFYNDNNSGSPFKQWNKGIREATGEYIWIAEADDFCDTRFLESVVEKLEDNPSVGLSYCQSYEVDSENQVRGSWESWTRPLDNQLWSSDFVINGSEVLSRFLIVKNIIPNASAVVFRRAVYEQAGFADENMRICGDWLMWARMLMQSDLAFTAQTLNSFRKHAASASHCLHGSILAPTEAYRVQQEIRQAVPISRATLSQAGAATARSWLDQRAELGWKKYLCIYRIARRFDPWLRWRLLAKLFRFIRCHIHA